MRYSFSFRKLPKGRLGFHFLAFLLAVLLLGTSLPCAFAAAEIPQTSAVGAIVMDCQTGELYYQKNADITRPIASMTKLMSVYLVFDEIQAGRMALDTPIIASANAEELSNDPVYSGMENLKAGTGYPLDTLLRLVMTASCNGSMLAIAEHISGTEAAFVERMNAKAVDWGVNARFADCCGRVDEGNAVTPRAMAEIARHSILDHPEILQYSSLKSTVFQGQTFTSTNQLLREGTFVGIDGLKSGSTTAAGHCFTGTALREGRRIISVVLAAGSYSARMTETGKMLEYGFACRAERESAWEKAEASLIVAFSAASGTVTPFAENEFRAVFTGMSGVSVPCSLTWEVGGKAYPAETATLTEGCLETFTAEPSAATDTLPIALNITFPDGHVLRRESSLGIGQPLTFSLRMGITNVSLYEDACVRIPCQVTCDQNVSCHIPVGWYLDGQPLTAYQNASFACSPVGVSSIIFNEHQDMTPGTHVLEFRCNPAGLPGVEQASCSTTIEVLSVNAAPQSQAEQQPQTEQSQPQTEQLQPQPQALRPLQAA